MLPPRHRARFLRKTLRIERLEDRLALSGFGPEDGSYVTEPWLGYYEAVQATSQSIVAMGMKPSGSYPADWIGVQRYNTLGETDTGYGNGGLAEINPPTQAGYTQEYGWDLALQGDKAVVAGQFKLASGTDIGVARLDTNGAPDSTFGRGGWNSLSSVGGSSSEWASGIGIQSNGDIIVGGTSAQSGNIVGVVASFTSSGAIDSGKGGFGQSVQGKLAGYVKTSFGNAWTVFHDIAVQPDNKVVAVGMTSAQLVDVGRVAVARYTSNGSLDTTFNKTGYSVFTPPASFGTAQGYAVALQSDGKIVVAGFCEGGIDASWDMLILRYNSNGTLDKTFGGEGYARLDIDGTATVTKEFVNSLAIQPDGKIVFSGSESLEVGMLVGRLNANGALDSSFGVGGFKIGLSPTGHSFGAHAIVLSGNDIILAGADYDQVLGETHPLLMRLSGASNAPSSTAATASATDAALMLLLTDTSTTTTKRK